MKSIKYTVVFAIAATILGSCQVDKKIEELSASYSGRIIDKQTGEQLALEYNSPALMFGDNAFDPTQPEVFYIKPDGSFNNDRMVPGNYEVSVRGPFAQIDTIHSFEIKGNCTFDVTVLPNVRLGSASAEVSANGKCKLSVGYTVCSTTTFGELSIVWGTAKYPGALTASTNTDNTGVTSWQKKYTFNGESGNATLTTGTLMAGKTYYVRIGARVNGSDFWNYSKQFTVTAQGVVE